MLTKPIHDAIADALSEYGYSVEEFNARNSDIMDIWHADVSLGYVEVTVCHVQPGYVILCPVDYDQPDGLLEIFDADVRPLVEQLDAFYGKPAPRKRTI